MRVDQIRICGIKAFGDSGDISFDQRCNVFVGQNNSGKSTFINAILTLQGNRFGENDLRRNSQSGAWISYVLSGLDQGVKFVNPIGTAKTIRLIPTVIEFDLRVPIHAFRLM